MNSKWTEINWMQFKWITGNYKITPLLTHQLVQCPYVNLLSVLEHMHWCNNIVECQVWSTALVRNQCEILHSYSNKSPDCNNCATLPANGIWTKCKLLNPISTNLYCSWLSVCVCVCKWMIINIIILFFTFLWSTDANVTLTMTLIQWINVIVQLHIAFIWTYR